MLRPRSPASSHVLRCPGCGTCVCSSVISLLTPHCSGTTQRGPFCFFSVGVDGTWTTRRSPCEARPSADSLFGHEPCYVYKAFLSHSLVTFRCFQLSTQYVHPSSSPRSVSSLSLVPVQADHATDCWGHRGVRCSRHAQGRADRR